MGALPRLVFMGSDPVALPLLDWLAGDGAAAATLAGVFTGIDRPSGRGQSVRPNAVKAWTEGRNLPVFQPEKLDAEAHAAMKALTPDLVLVVAYGRILREDFIAIPRIGTLNLHASLLPRHRGASPIQTAVAEGDAETGFALMRIVRELDAGPVAAVERVAIGPLDTAADVEARLALAAIPLLARTLPLIARGDIPFIAQDNDLATFCRLLDKADGVLDFHQPAAALAARINGLHPWPSVVVDVAGTPVKLGLAEATGGPHAAPGTITGADAHGVLVGTGAGLLRLRRLQRAGGRMLDAPEFLRGFPISPGIVLPSQPMRALLATSPFRR